MNAPSPPVVAAAPVLGVEPGHVAEASRALRAQGRDPSFDEVTRLLWAARALPVALDVLADARSGLSLTEVRLEGAEVLVHEGAAGTALVAIARLEVNEDRTAVEVQFLERRALLGTESDVIPAHCTVRLPVVRPPPAVEATPEDSVSVRRFTLGRPV